LRVVRTRLTDRSLLSEGGPIDTPGEKSSPLFPALEALLIRSRLAQESFFAIMFVFWQLGSQLLVQSLFDWQHAFRSPRDWSLFAAVSIAAGAVLGVVFSYARRRVAGWWRDWIEMFVRMVSVAFFVTARSFVHESLPRWLSLVAITALIMATLFTFPYRVIRRALRVAAGK